MLMSINEVLFVICCVVSTQSEQRHLIISAEEREHTIVYSVHNGIVFVGELITLIINHHHHHHSLLIRPQ